MANLPQKFQQKLNEQKLINDQTLSLESLGNLNTPYPSVEQYLKQIIFNNEIRPFESVDQSANFCEISLDVRDLLKKSNKSDFHSNYRKKLADLIKISKYFCHDFVTNQLTTLLLEFVEYDCEDFTAKFMRPNSASTKPDSATSRSC